MSEGRPKKHNGICKRFYVDDEYMLADMVEDTGLNLKSCIDLLYDYKERVFGEYVTERIYP